MSSCRSKAKETQTHVKSQGGRRERASKRREENITSRAVLFFFFFAFDHSMNSRRKPKHGKQHPQYRHTHTHTHVYLFVVLYHLFYLSFLFLIYKVKLFIPHLV